MCQQSAALLSGGVLQIGRTPEARGSGCLLGRKAAASKPSRRASSGAANAKAGRNLIAPCPAEQPQSDKQLTTGNKTRLRTQEATEERIRGSQF